MQVLCVRRYCVPTLQRRQWYNCHSTSSTDVLLSFDVLKLLPSSALFRCVHRHVVAVGSWLLSLACKSRDVLATFEIARRYLLPTPCICPPFWARSDRIYHLTSPTQPWRRSSMVNVTCVARLTASEDINY